METSRVLNCLRSAPLFQHLSDEKLAWIHEHAEELNLESGADIASQEDPADGGEVRLPVGGPGGEGTLASRNLQTEAGT
jgi:hypothetical protein